MRTDTCNQFICNQKYFRQKNDHFFNSDYNSYDPWLLSNNMEFILEAN